MFENDKLKLTTFVFGSVIFIAFIQQYTYYSFFLIDISDYIGLDEVLTPFIDDLSFFVLVTVFSVYMTLKEQDDDKNYEEDNKSEPDTRSWYHKVIGFFIWNFSKILTAIAGIVYMGYFLIKYKDVHLFSHVVSIVVLFLFYILASRSKPIESILRNNMNTYITFSILITVLALSQLKAGYDIYKKKYRDFNIIEYQFIIGEQRICTDYQNIYLGRTQKKIFIYRRNKKMVDVYNTSDINSEKVKLL